MSKSQIKEYSDQYAESPKINKLVIKMLETQ